MRRTLVTAITLALAASLWIVWLLKKHATQVLFCFALSLILGGALGNVIDRLVVGAVIDFLDFHVRDHHWPVFNVADTAISCGAILLVWEALTAKRRAAAA